MKIEKIRIKLENTIKIANKKVNDKIRSCGKKQ
jgi:hypothetical protein